MKREIKFRAWEDVGTKGTFRMTYDIGVLPIINQNEWVENANIFINPTKGSSILMQYTGLKDKNGKEIYEGDIMKDNWTDSIGYIEFSDGQFKASSFGYAEDIACRMEESEVIGNLYQNPELLN